MFKKISLAFLLTLSLLSGCASQKPEDVIREGITSELDTIKNGDADLLNDLSSEFETLGLDEFGIDPIEFAKSYLDGFDYTIHSIDVENDTASVQISLKIKSISEYMELIMKEAESLYTDPEISKLTEDQLYKKIGKILMDTIDKTSIQETDKITMELELKDNNWVPTNDVEELVSQAIVSN